MKLCDNCEVVMNLNRFARIDWSKIFGYVRVPPLLPNY